MFFETVSERCISSSDFIQHLAECNSALGMENGAITDKQISASSHWDANHAAKQGRLHFQAVPSKAGSWSAKANDLNQWLQIDLGNQQTKITGVATQGRNDYSQWVTKYKLQYSDNGGDLQYYIEQGQTTDKVSESILFNRNVGAASVRSLLTRLLVLLFFSLFTKGSSLFTKGNRFA